MLMLIKIIYFLIFFLQLQKCKFTVGQNSELEKTKLKTLRTRFGPPSLSLTHIPYRPALSVCILFFVFFLSAEDLQSECQRATAKTFRNQKILQGTSFNILAKAVSSSPSILGTIDPQKAETVVRLAGCTWPARNPKVFMASIYHLIW